MKVKLVLPSKTDNAVVYHAGRSFYTDLLEAGVRIYERKSRLLHAKSAVIDGRTVLVGSYNIDPRSQNLNAEAMCVADDEELARQLLASIEQHLLNAWTVAAHRPRISRARSIRLWGVRLLLPLIERQL